MHLPCIQIKDIEMAIEFCKEHNDEDLWNILIEESTKQPEIVTKVLDGIVGKLCDLCLPYSIIYGSS